MPKFTIHWTEELWYRMDVEADSEEDALDKFHNLEYDFDEAKNTDVHLQDSIYVEEVK
jgi:hypothetical protein